MLALFLSAAVALISAKQSAFVPSANFFGKKEATSQEQRLDFKSINPISAFPTYDERFNTQLQTANAADVDSAVSASVDRLEEYVKDRGGNLPIRTVLIANNGMAATKAILSMRQWAYMELGNERAIQFVVMATPEDLNANAEFIRLADRFVEVPGGVNRNNYANVDLIIKTAKEQGADGVWPGWGHASENPKLPAGLAAEGIKFIGPTSPVMSVLGDKIAANILAQTAKVNSIPWSGDGLEAVLTDEGTIPQATFDKATVTSLEEAVETAARVGFPIMIKASEGGGGKGIRMVQDPSGIEAAYTQVVNEVPGSPVFMMQLCTEARHLEVQIVGDEHGNAIALNGRDCSTQRRFQKIFEEGSPTICPPETFREMERAAQRLTQSIGYRGAGTVEYLYNAATNEYYFLELNPRLQVEHPVTEGITGVNLPATQLQVAMGIPLNAIPQIRAFMGKEDVYGNDKIDFLTEEYRPITQHVIAARLTAENPDEGFKPTSGKIERVKFQSTTDVWGYFSIGANGGIHEYADSQFGHIFASGPTREDARKRLILALKEVEVRGEIRTTVEYLVELLEMEAFKKNTIDTSWLDGLIREKSVVIDIEPHSVVVSAVITRAFEYFNKKSAEFVGMLEKGQLLLTGLNAVNKFNTEVVFEGTKYKFAVERTSSDTYILTINGQQIGVSVRQQPDGSLIAKYGGETHTMFGQEEALGLRLRLDGKTILLPTVYDPSELRTDITGKVVRYLQEPGAEVKAGEPYVEVEAMKMIMPLKAAEAGIITPQLSPGSIISAGDLLASLQLKDPSKVKKISDFAGSLDIAPESSTAIDLTSAADTLALVLDGYSHEVEPLVQAMIQQFSSPSEAQAAITPLLQRFLAVEALFEGKPKDEAMVQLAADLKDDKPAILKLAVAHQALPARAKLVTSLLRAVRGFTNQFGDWEVAEDLQAAVGALAALSGRAYGDVAVTASQLLDDLAVKPFSERLSDLRSQLVSVEAGDLQQFAYSPSLSAGVDLLTALFKDGDKAVRDAALEVYVRRVYRANNVYDVTIEDKGKATYVSWSFQFEDTPKAETPMRKGFLALVDGVADVNNMETVTGLLSDFQNFVGDQKDYGEAVNVLHLVAKDGLIADAQEADVIKATETTLKANMEALTNACGVRIVNVCLPQKEGQEPRYYTHATCDGFTEDPIRRNMRATFPYLLELLRLNNNFDLERFYTIARNAQIYRGKEKQAAGGRPARGGPQEVVFFRSIGHTNSLTGPADAAENIIVQALDELERTLLDPSVSPTASSRVFVNILPAFEGSSVEALSEEFRQLVARNLVGKYANRLLKLRVDEIEVKCRVKDAASGQIQPVRLIASSMSGAYLKPDVYLEYPDPVTGVTKQFCPLNEDSDVCLLAPYPTSNQIQLKRGAARRIGSTYAYDFLGLFEIGLIQEWNKHLDNLADGTFSGEVPDTIPAELFAAEELVLDGNKLVKDSNRLVGTNNIGMLAWHASMKTPEYPEGREVVIIANDVTVQSGSFGVKEDEFFFKASEYARERGLPRVYLSSNSGARIGLVEELKPKFKVAWNDENNPSAGYDYLYLSEEDYTTLPAGTVDAHEIIDNGEKRYKLSAIIGQIHGIGVENLRGSGMIAGETSRAYDETFTLSYITGRSVGIGAYLVRLGQRTIQMQNGPIILTGFSALNKLLGRDVYTSQDQLGGPQIMYPNGVTHEVVSNDQEGIRSILQWLSFVPKTKFDQVEQGKTTDPVDRPIGFKPTGTPYDPRHMLAGTTGADGKWLSGFFDKGSFKEYLAGWGKSVVVGRARLGGIPMGVISVETRLMEQRIPADPANPESREAIQPQAGQVWFPDSAFKTAQAIEDFNRGENLPLIIFANWRGFSGGTRDMYGEILKFGAMIVDGLRKYEHPVMIYIPPKGELRGGAWVVVDPTINEEMMEMYADEESRGGILEPPGICEVKFRAQDQLKTMHRLDPLLQTLDGELEQAPSSEEADKIRAQIKAREDTLLPLYLQVAHEFADLHDRAGRMKAKGVIRDSLTWENAREYFYWRVKRRLAEDKLVKRVKEADSSLSKTVVVDMLKQLHANADWDDNQAFLAWADSETAAIDEFIAGLKKNSVKAKVQELLASVSEQDAKDILSNM